MANIAVFILFLIFIFLLHFLLLTVSFFMFRTLHRNHNSTKYNVKLQILLWHVFDFLQYSFFCFISLFVKRGCRLPRERESREYGILILDSWFLHIFCCYILSNAFSFNYTMLCSAQSLKFVFIFSILELGAQFPFCYAHDLMVIKLVEMVSLDGEIDVVMWFSIAALFQHSSHFSNKTLLNNLFVAAFHSFRRETNNTRALKYEHWTANNAM